MGAGSVLLLHVLTRRFFGDLAALIACALALLYAPLPYLEIFLLRATPLCFASLAIVAVLQRRVDSAPRGWFFAGIVVGVASMMRTTFLGVGFLVLLSLPILNRSNRRCAILRAAVFAGGIVFVRITGCLP